jgi:hypothetical protein
MGKLNRKTSTATAKMGLFLKAGKRLMEGKKEGQSSFRTLSFAPEIVLRWRIASSYF